MRKDDHARQKRELEQIQALVRLKVPHSEKFPSVASDTQSIGIRTQKQYQTSSERSEHSPLQVKDMSPSSKHQTGSLIGSLFKPSYSEV